MSPTPFATSSAAPASTNTTGTTSMARHAARCPAADPRWQLCHQRELCVPRAARGLRWLGRTRCAVLELGTLPPLFQEAGDRPRVRRAALSREFGPDPHRARTFERVPIARPGRVPRAGPFGYRRPEPARCGRGRAAAEEHERRT